MRFHLPGHMAAPDGRDMPPFYRRLRRGLTERGARVEVVTRDYLALADGAEGTGFDFVHQGRLRRERLLNTGLAYVGSRWYVDPSGVFCDSSLARARFDPGAVPAWRARRFFDDLVADYVTPRVSRYAQPEAVARFGPGHIAVFLQNQSDPVERAQHMSTLAMVRAVVTGAAGRPVVVKPHPRNRGGETEAVLSWLAERDVTVTQANVHDVLAGAAVSVSISSAASVEGLLHRVPAVVFGRTDFHHCAETVTRPGDWPAACARALSRDWPYERFVWWFLGNGTVCANRPKMPDLVIARMVAAGADLGALGITAEAG